MPYLTVIYFNRRVKYIEWIDIKSEMVSLHTKDTLQGKLYTYTYRYTFSLLYHAIPFTCALRFTIVIGYVIPIQNRSD